MVAAGWAVLLLCVRRTVWFQGQRPNVLEYQVPAGWAGLADLLQVLEDSKATGSIRHYALAQATLEQVGQATPLCRPRALGVTSGRPVTVFSAPRVPASKLPFAHSYHPPSPRVGKWHPLAFLSPGPTCQSRGTPLQRGGHSLWEDRCLGQEESRGVR